jgi:lipoprotein-anchoring transpeptidase ErfK/SrfK
MKKNIIVVLGIGLAVIVVVLGLRVFKRSACPITKQAAGSVSALFEAAKEAESKNDLLEAKKAYQRIISSSQDNKAISRAQEALYDINIKIILSPLETEQATMYEVQPNDSLYAIAKRFNTTAALIKRSNNLSRDIIRPGERLRIWMGKFSCIVDKSQNLLTLKAGEEVIKVYTISTGKQNCTPIGEFTITSKLENPVWYKEGAVVLPNSPENILGSRWLGFSLAGYGIHGTTDPASIGQQVTAGCVRMVNQDVEELYDLLPVGTEVTIID